MERVLFFLSTQEGKGKSVNTSVINPKIGYIVALHIECYLLSMIHRIICSLAGTKRKGQVSRTGQEDETWKVAYS